MATATKTKPAVRLAHANPNLQEAGKPFHFKPGQSGNPSGHPKAVLEVVAAARAHTETALNTLASLTTKAKSAQARIMAATALLDRGWGKPVQPVLDETPKEPNPFEGWPVADVRAVLEVLKSFQGRPADLELFLAQARVATRQEVKG